MVVRTDKHGVPFQIDRRDAFVFSRYTWRIDSDGYARTEGGKRPHRFPLRAHTLVMGKAPPGMEWDHINRDKLDNRRRNLRAVPGSVNVRNRATRNRSGEKYVSFHCGAWQAQIGETYLGRFGTIGEAVAARNVALTSR